MLYSLITISSIIISLIKGQSILSSSSIHELNGFELDGNTELSSGSIPSITSPKDWAYFVNNKGPYDVSSGVYASGIITDEALVTYFDQATKDVKDVSQWLWAALNNEQTKTDIYQLFAYAKPLLSTNELLLYFGADRVGASGITANSAFGFWFVQDPSFGIKYATSTSGTFNGYHLDGDLLITANFANPPYIELFKWSGNGPTGFLKSLGSTTSKCDNTKTQTICATYNTAPSLTSLYYPYNGNVFQQTTFMEGGINVNAWTGSSNIPCFSKILAMTRTSTSTTATLKDFGLGNFELCKSAATLQCEPSQFVITKQQDGKTNFKFVWSLKISQSGVGPIYDVVIQIPSGFNMDNGQTAINIIPANTDVTLYYTVRTVDQNTITIPAITILYCFFDNCEPQYQRSVVASSQTCHIETLSPTHYPSSQPTSSPTGYPSPAPTRSPSSQPTSLPTAAPVTTTVFMSSGCVVTISDNFCYNFNYNWNICNHGDRTMYQIQVTNSKDASYLYTIPTLEVNDCFNQTVTFNPTRGSSNDPVSNGFEWVNTISAIGFMYINGQQQTVQVYSSSLFNCNLCLTQ